MIKISEEQANDMIAEELVKIGYDERIEEVYDELEKDAGRFGEAVKSAKGWVGNVAKNTGEFIKKNRNFYKRTGSATIGTPKGGRVKDVGRFIKRNHPFQSSYYKRTGSLFADAATGYTAKGRRAIKSGTSALRKARKSALKSAKKGNVKGVKEIYRNRAKALKGKQDRLSFGKRVTRGLRATGKASIPVAGTGAVGYGGYRGVKAIDER